MSTPLKALLAGAVVAGLAWHYCAVALDHAHRVNTFKARGDQSAYLFEAEVLYRNWHGLNDPPAVLARNRMPLFPAFLAAFYDPEWTDDAFFIAAKDANVYLSVVSLTLIGFVLFACLPALPAANVLLVEAFGVFVFKAGYAQSELLFYHSSRWPQPFKPATPSGGPSWGIARGAW